MNRKKKKLKQEGRGKGIGEDFGFQDKAGVCGVGGGRRIRAEWGGGMSAIQHVHQFRTHVVPTIMLCNVDRAEGVTRCELEAEGTMEV